MTQSGLIAFKTPKNTGVAMTELATIDQVQKVLMTGDLSSLGPEQRVAYYNRVCELVGLNPLTKPFDYLKLNGKEVLYANKGCGEQLRMRHHISLKIAAREKIEDVYVVTAEAIGKDGRIDSATGAVSVTGLKGDMLANAMMKAETKAKRRVTLSICGLNMLDEIELETIPSASIRPQQPELGNGIDGYADGEYHIPFGKWKTKKLSEIDHRQLSDYIWFLEDSAQKKGKIIEGVVKEFIDKASKHLADIEMKAFDGDAIETESGDTAL